MCPPYTHAAYTHLCIFHSFSISLIICCWNWNTLHVVPLSYPFLVAHYSIFVAHFLTLLQNFAFSQASLLHICCSHSLLLSQFIHLCFSHCPSPYNTFIFHLCLPIVLLPFHFLLFNAINAPCFITDCHFILLIIW